MKTLTILILFVLLAVPLSAQPVTRGSLSITGSFFSMSESDFNAPVPNRTEADCAVNDVDCLMFRDQFSDPTGTGNFLTPIFYRDPIAGVNTGMTARDVIRQQVALLGWPLVGIYISASGNTPHIAIPREDFPSQTGAPGQRADKLQMALDLAIEGIYKSEAVITDPTDPDFGQTVELRFFFVSVKIWNYHSDNSLYAPRGRDVNENWIGDFLALMGVNPPGDWWQEFQ